MEGYESLEEVLEGKSNSIKKVGEAFKSLPEEDWVPLKKESNSFPIKLYKRGSKETRTAILYEVRDGIDQNNLFGKVFIDENRVYISAGRRYSNGTYIISAFFLRKEGKSFRNVAFADYNSRRAVFDNEEVERMDMKKLRKFAYAVNQYLSSKYEII